MTYMMRLVRYGLNGDPEKFVDVVRGVASATAAFPLNDTATLALKMNTHAPGAPSLDELKTWMGKYDIGVEVSDGTSVWKEPYNGRFSILEDSTDRYDESGVYELTCLSVAEDLNWMPTVDTSLLNKEGKRSFVDITPGGIIAAYITQAQNAGIGTAIKMSFTSAADSNGQAWPKRITLELGPEVTARKLIDSLVDRDLIDWRMNGNTLEVYRTGGAMSTHVSTELGYGREITDGSTKRSAKEVADKLIAIGDKGAKYVASNPGPARLRGQRAAVQMQNGVETDSGLILLADSQLASMNHMREQLTRDLTFHKARSFPFLRYNVGNTVWASGEFSKIEMMRVYQVTLQLESGDEGLVSGNIVMGDRFLDALVRQSRRLDDIMGGATVSGSSLTEPVPPNEVTGRTPAQVKTPFTYRFVPHQTERIVTQMLVLGWQAVTTDVDGKSLDIETYQIEARKSGYDQWASWGSIGGTGASIPGLRSNDAWEIRIRAVAAGRPGAWSTPQAVTVPPDNIPPPAPTAPILKSSAGVVWVEWDQKFQDGSPMPFNIEAIEVLDPNGAILASLPYPSWEGPIGSFTPGTEVALKLRATNTSGLKGSAGPVATVAVASVLDDTDRQQMMNDMDTKIDEALTGLKIDGGQVTGVLKPEVIPLLTSEKVLITSTDNLITDPEWKLPPGTKGSSWTLSSGTFTGPVDSPARLTVTSTGGITVLRNTTAIRLEEVTGGTEYRIQAIITGPGGGTAQWAVRWLNSDKTINSYLLLGSATTLTSATRLVANANAPVGASSAVFELRMSVGVGTQWGINPWLLRRRFGGELVVDGSITASKLYVDEAYAQTIKASLASFDSVFAGSIKAGMLAVDALNYKTATGMTLTSSTVQTNSESNVGIKINTSGIQAYYNGLRSLYISNTGSVALGSNALEFNAGTGRLKIKGDFATNGGAAPCVIIDGDTWNDMIGIKFYNSVSGGMNQPEIKSNLVDTIGWRSGSLFLTSARPSYGHQERAEIVVGGEGNSSSGAGELSLNVHRGTDSSISAYMTLKHSDFVVNNNAKLYRFLGIPNAGTNLPLSIASDWSLRYTGSIRAIKQDITDVSGDPEAIFALRPITYRDRESVEKGWPAEPILGLIAEEVEEAAEQHPELKPLVQYLEGELAGVDYGRLPILMLPLLRKIVDDIAYLKGLHS